MEATQGRGPLLFLLAGLVLITVATNTTASLAQPQIGAEFGVGPADTGWVVFGYSATFAVATAVYGGLAARIGLIPALVTGIALLGVGSLLAVAAPSMELLIGSRLVQGAGSGAIPTLATALIARSFPVAERTRAFGVIVAAVGAGQAAGPIIGGLLLEVWGWRAAVSIGIVAVPAVVMLQRSERGRHDPPPGGSFDLSGAALVAAVALGLAFVLNRLPVMGLAPATAAAIAGVVTAVVLLAGRVARVPAGFVPRQVVTDPAFIRVAALGALGMSAYIGTVVLVPVLASRAYGLAGLTLGLLLLPMAIAAAVSSPNSGRVAERIGARPASRLALGALGGGALMLALGAEPLGLGVTLPALAALGTGFGLLNAPLLANLTERFTGQDQPTAVGIYNLCFFLGGAVGAALSSAIVQVELALPALGEAAVPGFPTAELALSALPLIVAVAVLRRPRAQPA